MAKFICTVCVYTYDETEQTTPFEALDDDWVCPKCGASKWVFEPEDTPPKNELE